MNDVARNESGQFEKGTSGNPLGRPKNAKAQITELKQNLEVAIRENVNAKDIQDIVTSMVDLAKKGSVQAAKLVLDKTISNAKEAEDVAEAGGGIQVIVRNATLQVAAPESDCSNPPIEHGEIE